MFSNLHQGLVALCMHHIANNDVAHRTAHIMQVAEQSKAIAKHYNLDETRMLLATLLHDIFSGRSRVDHHQLAANWVRGRLMDYGYSAMVVEDVALMCEEHRDSGAGAYTNIYGEAFAAADRGPINIAGSVERAFGRTIQSISDEELDATWPKVIDMLRSKFGPRGTACFNEIHAEIYHEEVRTFQGMLENMSDQHILQHVKNTRKFMRTSWPAHDEHAYKGMYVINDGMIATLNPVEEQFELLLGRPIPVHAVTIVQGMLQLNKGY